MLAEVVCAIDIDCARVTVVVLCRRVGQRIVEDEHGACSRVEDGLRSVQRVVQRVCGERQHACRAPAPSIVVRGLHVNFLRRRVAVADLPALREGKQDAIADVE